jgi:hypothetical protein
VYTDGEPQGIAPPDLVVAVCSAASHTATERIWGGSLQLRIIANVVVALFVATGAARASSIGVFFDAAGTDCDAQIPENSAFTIYVIAILSGDAAAAGVTGAEYQLLGADPAWLTMVTPNPTATFVIGSPIDGVGANIGWPSCQTPATGTLLLHTITGFSPGATSPRTLRVVPRFCAHACYYCPLVTLCDIEFTKLCVSGGEAFVNRPTPCNVAVQPSTWTQVRALYRN